MFLLLLNRYKKFKNSYFLDNNFNPVDIEIVLTWPSLPVLSYLLIFIISFNNFKIQYVM